MILILPYPSLCSTKALHCLGSTACLPFSTVLLSPWKFSYPLQLIPFFLTSSFLSSHLLLWPPTAPLLSGCQAKVTIFFRVLGSAFLLSVGFFSLFIFTPSPNYRIFFLSSGGGIFDWTGVRREIFTVSDLCGFLKLIIPHWAQPWHCRERHKSSDSCCWACANPGECFFLACFFPSIHFFVLISSAPLFDIFSLIPLTFSVFPFY